MKLEGITPEKFAAAKVQAVAQHLTVDAGDTGVIQGHGVVATFAYNQTTLDLDVEVTHKPFYIPEQVIESGIDKWFAEPAA